MLKRLLCAALLGLLGTSVAVADPVLNSEVQAPLASKPLTVEQRLQAPAEVELGDGETITFGALLTQIQERHGLTVQLHRSSTMLMTMMLEEGLVPRGELAAFPKRSNSSTAPSGEYLQSPVKYLPIQVQSVQVDYQAPVGTVAPPVPPCSKCESASASPAYYAANSDGGLVLLSTPTSSAEFEDPTALEATVDAVLLKEIPATEASEEPVTPPIAPVVGEAAGEAEVVEAEPVSVVHALGVCQNAFLQTEVNTSPLRGRDMTVEQVLRRAIDQIATAFDASEEMTGLPVAYSHAYDWDLLIDENCVFITTRLHANLHKVARVYRIPQGSELDAEEVALVLRKTIRPWSWQDQIGDVVEMVKFELPEGMNFPSLPQISKIDLTGAGDIVQFEEGSESDSSTGEAVASVPGVSAVPAVDSATAYLSMKALGSLMSSGTIAAAHTVINTVEMLHFADPPTATIQVLPGMLVISQSQGAHREIADLLEQVLEAPQE